MQIIEQTTVGKLSQEECEDGIIATDDFIAVIDGSTSKTEIQISNGMSNGKFCMLTVADYIRKMLATTTADEFCQSITERIRNIYAEHSIPLHELQAEPVMRIAASAVIFSRERNEIWMIGDCQCIVNGKLYENPKPQEKEIALLRAGIIKEALKLGESVEQIRTNDIGRKAILPLIIKGCRMQNIAYSVIDGFQIPMQHVKIISVPPAAEIMLASDGYPLLRPTIKESEEELRRLLHDDPLCIYEIPATKGLAMGQKSFDDRCAISFIA